MIARNLDERIKEYNLAIRQLSEINEQNIMIYYMLDCYNKAMDIKIDIEKYKKSIGRCSDNLKEICDACIENPTIQQSVDDINKEVSIARNEIEKAIRLITKQMTSALKNM